MSIGTSTQRSSLPFRGVILLNSAIGCARISPLSEVGGCVPYPIIGLYRSVSEYVRIPPLFRLMYGYMQTLSYNIQSPQYIRRSYSLA